MCLTNCSVGFLSHFNCSVGPLNNASPSNDLKMETDPVSEILCFSRYLELQMMDKVHKFRDSMSF
jgi:hypothetical protein